MSTSKTSLRVRKSAPEVLRRKALFRFRRKNGLGRVPVPWAWLAAADAKQLVSEAYQLASHEVAEAMSVCGWTHNQLQQAFLLKLVQTFADVAVCAAAAKKGIVPETPELQKRVGRLADAYARLPDDWRPQYPVFMKLPVAPDVSGVKS